MDSKAVGTDINTVAGIRRQKSRTEASPVVEEGRREAASWQRIEDAIFEGLDANISCTQNKVRDLAKLLTARVTAILALTPVEGVGMLQSEHDRIFAAGWDCARNKMNKHYGTKEQYERYRAESFALSTPATAQGDVREALEP